LKTLRGTYVFSASGFTIVAGVAQSKAILGVIDFNGDGTLSVPSALRSVNGVIARSLHGGSRSNNPERNRQVTKRLIKYANVRYMLTPSIQCVL